LAAASSASFSLIRAIIGSICVLISLSSRYTLNFSSSATVNAVFSCRETITAQGDNDSEIPKNSCISPTVLVSASWCSRTLSGRVGATNVCASGCRGAIVTDDRQLRAAEALSLSRSPKHATSLTTLPYCVG
jgi:hypothetical protein